MPEEHFAEARLKIKRANQHIMELNTILNEFFRTDFYALSVEQDLDTREYSLHFQMLSNLPDVVPSIISEVMQPLRSALDYAMTVMVIQAGGKGSREVQFPINETREKVESTINNGQIKRLSPAVKSFILDIIKPYKGGNDTIYGLHTMNNVDKHHHLMPIVSITALTGVNFRTGGATFTNTTFSVSENRVLKAVASNKEFEFQDFGKPVLIVGFDKGQPFEGQAVIPTLLNLSKEIGGYLDIFDHMS